MEEIYAPPWRKKEESKSSGTILQKYKVLVILFVSIFLIGGSVVAVRTYLKASSNEAQLANISGSTPYAVKFVEVSSNSFVIEWKTKQPTIGFIKYGENEKTMNLIGQSKDNPGSTKTSHKVTIDGLIPGQRYYVEIHSNAQTFGENGLPLDIKTLD